MQNLSKEEVVSEFNAAVAAGLVKNYEKYRNVDARLAVVGEKITTVINGEVETTNTAVAGQVVVMNKTTQSREQWLIGGAKFADRYTNQDYKITSDWSEFQPIGTVDAFVWTKDEVKFDAPWGEEMIMKTDDYLARIPGTTDDIYRIAKDEFEFTYR